eukprot:s487_g13.t1
MPQIAITCDRFTKVLEMHASGHRDTDCPDLISCNGSETLYSIGYEASCTDVRACSTLGAIAQVSSTSRGRGNTFPQPLALDLIRMPDPQSNQEHCTEDMDTDENEPMPVCVKDPLVHFGIDIAGARELTPTEQNLRAEFFDQHIYLIRGVKVEGLPVPDVNRAEALAFGLIACGQAKWDQLERLLGLLPGDRSLRWQQEDAAARTLPPKRFTAGAWVRGPMTGANIHSRMLPWTTRVLAGIIGTWDVDLPFTTVTLSLNVQASPHRDSYSDSRSKNLMLPCSTFTGGEMFIEHETGIHKLKQDGPVGQILSAQEALLFSPRRTHATLPWCGTRLILIAFHIGDVLENACERIAIKKPDCCCCAGKTRSLSRSGLLEEALLESDHRALLETGVPTTPA